MINMTSNYKRLGITMDLFNLFFVIIFIIVAIYVHLDTSVETFTYTTHELQKNSTIVMHKPDTLYTNYIYSSIYSNNKKTKGYVYSINNHLIMNNVNNVMGNVTYKTDKGTLSGLIYYDTRVDDLYLYGKINNVKVDNESGYYNGRHNIIHIEGKDNGDREVTIISRPTAFGI